MEGGGGEGCRDAGGRVPLRWGRVCVACSRPVLVTVVAMAMAAAVGAAVMVAAAAAAVVLATVGVGAVIVPAVGGGEGT